MGANRLKAIEESEWLWYGHAAHFICGRWCRFHLATKIGDFLVSTVGLFVHPSKSGSSEQEEAAWLAEYPNGDTIGFNRFYETMVFRAGKECDAEGCGCGLPKIFGSELDFDAYNDAKAATIGHRMMCLRVAMGNVKVDA